MTALNLLRGYILAFIHFHAFESSISMREATIGLTAMIKVSPISELRKELQQSRVYRVTDQAELFAGPELNPESLFTKKRTVLTPSQMQRIAHQLDQKCRDVEPTAKKEKAWK